MKGFVHSADCIGSIPTELVARLEAASVGSRSLDAAIAEALGWTVHNARRGGLWAVTDGRRYEDLGYSEEDQAALLAIDVWTQSLDAALALAERVLPECLGTVSFGALPSNALIYGGTVSPREAVAKTPALALCIAILKATSASSVGTTEGRAPKPAPTTGEA